MPTVTLNRKIVDKLIGKKISTDKLKERISYLGTDLEHIDDQEIHVEIFPKRPDLLSEQGFARALSSFIGVKTGLRKYNVKKSNEKVIVEKSVQKVRPYTVCAIIKNISFDDEKIREVIQIQEKLHTTFGRNRKKVAIGIYPLEKIKMPIRYIAKKPQNITFTPLESNKEMTAQEILELHPKGKEFAHLLEQAKEYPLFIDANDQVLSMPPVINSHTVGKVTTKTKEIFLECSGFDLLPLQQCTNMIAAAFADMGASVYAMEVQYEDQTITTPNLEPTEKEIDYDYINTCLGLDLSKKEINMFLEKMGFGIKSHNALIPAYRTDILHQADLAEDVAIAYGYENFTPELTKAATLGNLSKQTIIKTKIANALIGLGMLETSTYHISGEESQNEKMCEEKNIVKLQNALTIEYSVMRHKMLPSLMEVLVRNKHYEHPQKIFEIGTIFSKDKTTETGVKEQESLCVVLCGKDENYTSIKQILQYLETVLDIKLEVKTATHASFIAGRVGKIIFDNKEVGVIGEISPQVLSKWELTFPIACLEIDMGFLIQ